MPSITRPSTPIEPAQALVPIVTTASRSKPPKKFLNIRRNEYPKNARHASPSSDTAGSTDAACCAGVPRQGYRPRCRKHDHAPPTELLLALSIDIRHAPPMPTRRAIGLAEIKCG